jgi:hypothetical protein
MKGAKSSSFPFNSGTPLGSCKVSTHYSLQCEFTHFDADDVCGKEQGSQATSAEAAE